MNNLNLFGKKSVNNSKKSKFGGKANRENHVESNNSSVTRGFGRSAFSKEMKTDIDGILSRLRKKRKRLDKLIGILEEVKSR